MTGVFPKMRCGSFPLMNIADDFGVDYGDVLLLFEMALVIMRGKAAGVLVEALNGVPPGRALTWIEAGERMFERLGDDRAEALGNVLRPLAEARAAL